MQIINILLYFSFYVTLKNEKINHFFYVIIYIYICFLYRSSILAEVQNSSSNKLPSNKNILVLGRSELLFLINTKFWRNMNVLYDVICYNIYVYIKYIYKYNILMIFSIYILLAYWFLHVFKLLIHFYNYFIIYNFFIIFY